MNPVRNNEQNMNTLNKTRDCVSSISNGMKKMLALSFVVLLGFAAHALAATSEFTALAPIPHLTDAGSVTSVLNSSSLALFFNNLYKYLIGLAATLAVIEIIYAGIDMAIHPDNAGTATESKGRIYNAIYGLVLVLSPVLVFSIINPAILNLSLDLPRLDTKAVNTTSSTPPDSTNGAIPFTKRTTDAPISGYWCSRDTGSGRFLCSDTQDGCDAARNANALLITESCVLAP